MSENPLVTGSFQAQESFASNNNSKAAKFEDAAQIFDLISQLNSTLSCSNSPGAAAVPVVNSPRPIDECESASKPSTSSSSRPAEKLNTKIPRMAGKPPPAGLPVSSQASQSIAHNLSSSASNSSMGSIPPQHHSQPMSPDAETMIPRPVTMPPSSSSTVVSRVPRSIVRNSALAANAATQPLPAMSTTGHEVNGRVNGAPLATNGAVFNTKIPGIAKRGVSLSNSSSKMKSTRSMSINDGSKENLDDCESVVSSEGKKKVRYVIRHKPRESQVKIFSQKLEVKAQAKIGSLEKAAVYKPSGGNVKIESHKLTWKAQAKIGSLEHANQYTPKGGNVKIESFKLNFREKARPKTDTGLIVVEEFIDTKSYNNSNDDLTKSQLSFAGSN